MTGDGQKISNLVLTCNSPLHDASCEFSEVCDTSYSFWHYMCQYEHFLKIKWQEMDKIGTI